jgi:anti-sigma-K factor RskA
MKLLNPNVRDLICAEYVLGTLQGRTRKQFAKILNKDIQLQKQVVGWEERFVPMVAALPDIEPPAYILKNLVRKIGANETAKVSFWSKLEFWRTFGLTAAALAVALMVAFILPKDKVEVPSQAQAVAMLNDGKSQPAWFATISGDRKNISIKTIQTNAISAEQSYELWMIPNNKQAPVSLGLVSMSGETKIILDEAKQKIISNSAALAISLEPKGGSPTGAPTGPVLFVGALVSL